MLYTPTFLQKHHSPCAPGPTLAHTGARWYLRLWRALCESAERPTRKVPYY